MPPIDPGRHTPRRALRPGRLGPIVATGLALGLLASVQILYFQRGLVPGDALVYLAAGERLNAGHALYSLAPGDRPVGLKPPYWTVPLLSPPLIAVVFRPLALLPDEIGAYLWWVATIGAVLGSMFLLLRRRPVATSALILVLVIPIAYEIGVGNLNALVLLGTIAMWCLTVRGRDLPAGVIVGVMAAAKVTPGMLAWWFIVQRRWRGLAGVLAGGSAGLAVGVLGAGLAPHLEYLGIARSTATSGASELSLAGLARAAGVPEAIAGALPTAALVLGAVAVALLAIQKRPGAAFAVAIVTSVLGSPVVNVNWYAYLLATLAPLAWPARDAELSGRLGPTGPGGPGGLGPTGAGGSA